MPVKKQAAREQAKPAEEPNTLEDELKNPNQEKKKEHRQRKAKASSETTATQFLRKEMGGEKETKEDSKQQGTHKTKRGDNDAGQGALRE